ncbi:MAG TPA: hypothetical protein VHT27_09685 [Solirubrobacteraceae bacterium]|jgi:hypothetical protein|nr:hypothetical protein [Solirubrobacteraceae bacterium]
MPDATSRFEHLEILRELRSELIAAADRQGADRHATADPRTWRSRPMNAAVIALLLVLAGGAIAVAATGVLGGSPVKQQGTQRPNSGIGVPAQRGADLLALRAPDPEGGLPWGMRLVHTTRGETCVQIGRLDGGQLGQLGIDGAFHDDGRFHPLPPNVDPEYSDPGDVSCNAAGQNAAGQIKIGNWPSGDRSAAPNGPGLTSFRPIAKDLRTISWGLLGPHAVSVTYKSRSGVLTVPVVPGTGAYLIVGAVDRVPDSGSIGAGGEALGWTSGHDVTGLGPGGLGALVTAATFRFGSFTCSIGHGAAVARICPKVRSLHVNPLQPTRTLSEPVRVTLRAQRHDSCSAAYLVDPCYRAEVEFKAPFTITSASSEYFVRARSSCNHARASSWSTSEDIQRGETVRTQSSGLFNCTSDQFTVQYLNDSLLPVRAKSVIVGTASVRPPTSR